MGRGVATPHGFCFVMRGRGGRASGGQRAVALWNPHLLRVERCERSWEWQEAGSAQSRAPCLL